MNESGMNTIVTLDMLRQANACQEAITAFKEAFPDGSATLQQIIEHPNCKREWIGWMVVYAPWITAETGPAMIEHSDYPEFWRGKAAVYAPWVTAEIGTDLIEHSDDPRYWREKAAAHARWAQPNMEKDK